MDYEEYLLSPHWISVKVRMYKKYRACQRCGATKRLNVHHKTYERIGREYITDLVLLCKPCHFREHRMNRGIGKWKPSDILAIFGIFLKNFLREYTISS